MKILHWAIVLIIIVLPFSIICRNTVNSRFAALKDEVRINNAIDTATKDAIDQIIDVSGFEYDDEFGDVINVTPALAQETINTFFHTLAINYNIPYKMSDTTNLGGDSSLSYIKTYFAQYVPAVVILAYDGFYIYSQENSGGGYKYELSTKIPYTYNVPVDTSKGITKSYSIGYTLGNDIYLYVDGECYSGRINDYNTFDEIKEEYEDNNYNSSSYTTKDISYMTNDMSMIIYALRYKNGIIFENNILPDSTTTNFMQDYTKTASGTYEVGKFHENRRKVITNIISECLTQEINVEHNRFADLVGSTYQFVLPEITEDDWINAINDISIMAFVQGIPVGTANGTYFNSYALGGSQIVKRDYLYGNKYSGVDIYHYDGCSLIESDNYDNIFITADDAIAAGYVECQLCN